MVRDVQGHVDPPSTAGATTWVMAEYYLPEALDAGKHVSQCFSFKKERKKKYTHTLFHAITRAK
jgi:hypothetical protein